jgi:hypothetical protein
VYGCETWSLILEEEEKLKVYENRKWQEDGEDYTLRSFITSTLRSI